MVTSCILGGGSSLLSCISDLLSELCVLQIVFNPVTANSIKRLLTKIASTEKCRLSGDYISAIAENCGGDLRHAISTLQFQCTGHCLNSRNVKDIGAFEFGSARNYLLEDSVVRSSEFASGTSSSPTYGRDNVFSLFHALGKFLHNKRHLDQGLESTQESVLVISEDYKRHPLNMEVPERILSEAQIEFPSLVAFLHENVLDFVDEDAIDDVADILAYLGDADTLLNGHFKGTSHSPSLNDITPLHLASLAAGSVAARGVLFANTHPAPRKWQSLRAPTLWQVERLLSEKKVFLLSIIFCIVSLFLILYFFLLHILFFCELSRASGSWFGSEFCVPSLFPKHYLNILNCILYGVIIQDSMSRKSAAQMTGGAPPVQLSWHEPSESAPNFLPSETDDEPMDDIVRLTADCIVDLDSLEDLDLPFSNTQVQMVHVNRGPLDSFPEDYMEEEDVIEDDDD